MINWKIDLADLINTVLIIIGGVLGYCLIERGQAENSRIQAENSRIAIVETLAGNIKSISPGLDTHYTNRISADGSRVDYRVYIKNVSSHDIWIPVPTFKYQSADSNAQTISLEGVKGFKSMLAPGVDLCIPFSLPRPQHPGASPSLEFEATTLDAYRDTLLLAVDGISNVELKDALKASIEKNTRKTYGYGEQIYAHEDHPIWEDFCSNPR